MTFRAMGCEVVVDGASGAEVAAVADLFGRRDTTFSRFDPASELNRINTTGWDPVVASDNFARMLRVAVGAARETGGLVTPAVGAAVVSAGYDRDFTQCSTMRAPQRPPRCRTGAVSASSDGCSSAPA